MITLVVVPGTTVLFTTIIGFFVECRRETPIFFEAFLIILKSMKPDFDFGVPTVRNMRSQFFTIFSISDEISSDLDSAFFRNDSNLGSKNSDFFEVIFSIF